MTTVDSSTPSGAGSQAVIPATPTTTPRSSFVSIRWPLGSSQAAGSISSPGSNCARAGPPPALFHRFVRAGDDEGQLGSGDVPDNQVTLPPLLVRYPPQETRLLQRPRRERDLIHRLKRVVAQRDLLEVVALAIEDLRHRVRPRTWPPAWPTRPPTTRRIPPAAPPAGGASRRTAR